MNTELMFSSKTDLWETPQILFDELNREFKFRMDACATSENAKCSVYYDMEKDGLVQPWDGPVWRNPPYGREIAKWVKKAWEEWMNGNTVVMLLPARTDTRWFHDYIYNKQGVEIRFLRGRLKFGGCKNSAPFPSMIVIYRKA